MYNFDPNKEGEELEEIGKEEFYFPLLYYNGHGIKEHFHIYKDNLSVGKILLQTQFEASLSLAEPPYVEKEVVVVSLHHPEPTQEPEPPVLGPKDSLLMDEEVSAMTKARKFRRKRHESKPKVREWNDRFWVDGMSNFDRTHPYYKVCYNLIKLYLIGLFRWLQKRICGQKKIVIVP